MKSPQGTGRRVFSLHAIGSGIHVRLNRSMIPATPQAQRMSVSQSPLSFLQAHVRAQMDPVSSFGEVRVEGAPRPRELGRSPRPKFAMGLLELVHAAK